MQPESLSVVLPIRRLVEFLLRNGSLDSRFTGFDRANEGARLHRKLQRAAVKEHPDYTAEVALTQEYGCNGIQYTLEGRADGIFTDEDGIKTIDEIKTTLLPSEQITVDHAPEHWAQAKVYAAIYAQQQNLDTMRVRLTYYQVEEEQIYRFAKTWTCEELTAFVEDLLTQYAPWAKRAAAWRQKRQIDLQALGFPFPQYRTGQRAMIGAVYETCRDGGHLLCQAPTGIGKTMSVLFPALKALKAGGPVFYLTARGTTRAAAESALSLLHVQNPDLALRSVTLTAKDKICMLPVRECTPEACPYANGYFDKIRTALWKALDEQTLTSETLQDLAREYQVCPFELGLDLSLWCDVVIGDYNYLFDPVVRLVRFFDSRGDYLFLIDEAHNLPGRARDMHSASLSKSRFLEAKKQLGSGKSSLKTALHKVNEVFLGWRHRCEEECSDTRFGKTFFEPTRAEALDRALTRLCEPLELWLDDHRDPGETHDILLQLYFDVRAWLRVADTFDDHFVLQVSAYGSEVHAAMLCLDPSAFLASDFAKGRAAVLFSATLTPAGYYKDLCGLPDARAVALRSPFPPANLGLWCARHISTRYKDRQASITQVSDLIACMARGKAGNYLVFFPSYSYLQNVWEDFSARYPDLATLCQESSMDESQRTEFLAHFSPEQKDTLVGFAVLGGVFSEGVDFIGDRLIGVAIVGPGLPQVGPRQEQLRDHFEKTRGSGFDYAYRYPGMNKVLQAAGRVIRTPQDKGVVLLIDDRFTAPDTRRLLPPHWSHLRAVNSVQQLETELTAFWNP